MLNPDSERRVYPRFAAPKGTTVAWHSSNRRMVSSVDNFGLGGLFIWTPDPPPAGTLIRVLIDVPIGEVRAGAAVKRSSPKQGIGVKFAAMEHEHRARFADGLRLCPPDAVDHETRRIGSDSECPPTARH